MKGMAAMKYHFILGMVENVSTFMPGTSVLLLALSMTLAGALRTEEADDERQGEEYECDPTQSPHCVVSMLCFRSLEELDRTHC